MKNLKKLLGLFLALSLIVVSLAACGTKEDAKEDNQSDKTEDNQTGDNSETGDMEQFIIGGIGPLTGAAASYGVSVKQGAEIAVEEINAAGGVTVGDKKYELVLNFMDDEAAAEKAVTAFNALMDDGMNALMGTVTSGAGLGILDLVKEEGILMLTPSGSAAGLTEPDNAFRLCFTDPLQGITMANFAKDQGYTKLAVIYNNSDEYSTGMMEAFVEQVKSNGGEIVASESFVTNDVDFNTQLTSIKATDAQAIFVPAYYNDAAYITTQAAALGMELPFLGGDGWDGVIAQTVDPAVLEGAIFLTPFLATDEKEAVKSFVTKYEDKFGATPDQFAADGYDSIYVIAAAMEKAGSIESADLIAAMTQIEVDGLTGNMTFNADGEPNKGANFVVIKDGQYTAN
ncbi:ABC transporter substrate-binding protein [Mobilitalea sibirica]|uniref:ABC transporter substrate-binding protein n=1 Tax=Mobilitalea sibirica TaxID=1462919 RepID=A0A8J7KVN3_9FIRM|nr:ABC transporter substrate-binding protein [Mobilitalea sibirica]MBH1940360.1 ABC transporter substrate-binding protein [Mobilitalea sibirica]